MYSRFLWQPTDARVDHSTTGVRGPNHGDGLIACSATYMGCNLCWPPPAARDRWLLHATRAYLSRVYPQWYKNLSMFPKMEFVLFKMSVPRGLVVETGRYYVVSSSPESASV